MTADTRSGPTDGKLIERLSSEALAATVAADRRADPAVVRTVSEIIEAVRRGGDEAVREYAVRFDGWAPAGLRLSEEEVQRAVDAVDPAILEDLRFAHAQVKRFAEAQRASLTDVEVETLPGVRLGHRHVPVGAVGAYVPGGRYPMVASALMSVTTARTAGVRRIAACTPPLQGAPAHATVAAMQLAGADEIYALGGVHALAALAVGTETIDPVDVLVGPGNAYVAEAKRQLFGEVGIDLLAGPTEILILADASADPELVACDLLGQAEHGPDSPAVLITTSRELAEALPAEIERQLADLPTRATAGPAWREHGRIHLVERPEDVVALADRYAYEHVEVLTADPRWYLDRLHEYGALFLGAGTTVAFGDKTIGTNHILPTSGAARYTGGLWVGKFLKTVTYSEVSDPASLARIAEVNARQCRVEGFEGHARTADLRLRRARAVQGAPSTGGEAA
jgi:sulfopropanediol 3-dehydrogenase